MYLLLCALLLSASTQCAEIISVNRTSLRLGNRSEWLANSSSLSCAVSLPSLCVALPLSPSRLVLELVGHRFDFAQRDDWQSEDTVRAVSQWLDPLDDPTSPHRRRLWWGKKKKKRKRKARIRRQRARAAQRRATQRRETERKQRISRKRKRVEEKRKKVQAADRRKSRRRRAYKERVRRIATKRRKAEMKKPPWWWFHPRTGPEGPKGRRGHTGRRGPRGVKGRSGVALFRGFFRGIRHALNGQPRRPRNAKGRRVRSRAVRRARRARRRAKERRDEMLMMMLEAMMRPPQTQQDQEQEQEQAQAQAQGDMGGASGAGLEMMARRRRRRLGDELYGADERVERCAWVSHSDVAMELCVSHSGRIDDAQVSVASYESNALQLGTDTETDTDSETEEWVLEGASVEGRMLYECNDNFADFETVCIEKWRLDGQHVTLTVKARQHNAEPLELEMDLERDVDDALRWSQRYLINGREMRWCCRVGTARVCAHFTVDAEQAHMRQITRIAISKPRI